jgi:predicted dehydrogenase
VSDHPTPQASRRAFLHTTAATAAAVSVASVPLVHAQGNDVIKVGLIGCGGRGSGAARNILQAGPNIKLWAMGDAFQDRLTGSYNSLFNVASLRPKIDCPAERRFTGFNAYQNVINSGVDVVLLTTPPHFRPMHLEAAINAHKHVFAEKPVAVDGPGVRRVLAACQLAQQRRLSVVSGLCWRYHTAMKETLRRIQDNQIGDIVALQCNYITGTLWHHARQPGWSDMEYQVRNWLYFTWLSGDFNVEQHVHSLDKMAWAMRDQYPVKCYGMGGRQQRTGAEFGHIYDHMSCVYEYPNGTKVFSLCRQMEGCFQEVKDYVIGTNGRADLMRYEILGPNAWRFPIAQANQADMYQQEMNELIAGIRNNTPINNGVYMAKSSLMGIMGRMACYTGQLITWEQALNSQENLSPQQYMWGPMPTPPVPMPGQQG